MPDKVKAILMAAGRGTRISREINDYCKCTLDIGGVPLIRYTAQMLLDSGIEVHIAVGYDKQRIIDALTGLPVTLHENVFYSITNSLVSLWFARQALSGDMIILGNADVYWENNLLSALMNGKRDCVMLSDSSRVEQGDYLFKVVDGKVVNYGKGMDCRQANCEYVGLAAIRGGIISECRTKLEQMVQRQRHGDWWEQIFYDMIPERDIWSEDVAGNFWAEIDYIEDYYRILEHVKNG